jgi:Xaa-Pro aminopeptidase
VNKGSETAVASLLVTANRVSVFFNSSEKFRIPDEELSNLPFDVVDYSWNEDADAFIKKQIAGLKVASDACVPGTEMRAGDLARLFYAHTEEEIERYRKIGSQSTVVMESAARLASPGQTEYGIAGSVTGALMSAGFQVPVCLIASDERLLKYRHPIPTAKVVGHIVMVAVTVQKFGLNVSISRIVSFGPLSDETRRKQDAVVRIDANLIASTVPGVKVGDIVKSARRSYEKEGYSGDFELHHQGGAMGYAVRYYCAPEHDSNVVADHQAFSWNPTIAGVKSEDTCLVLGNTQEIVSRSGSWPQIKVDVGGRVIERPDILVM